METTSSGRASLPKKNRGRFSLALGIVCVLLLFACATSNVQRMLPGMGTMYVAKHYLGEPTTSEALPGGRARHNWLLDRVVLDPAHIETRRVFIGHDSDGYPVFEDVDMYIPDRRIHQKCRVSVVVDRNGNFLDTFSEGDSCDALLKVPV
jgi:hypothetical protein